MAFFLYKRVKKLDKNLKTLYYEYKEFYRRYCMPRLNRESSITVGNKEFIVDDLLKTIIYLPAPQVQNFFSEIGLTIPREIRIYVLREVLREKVIETRKSRLTLADEINYRLSWYTEFSETQLENLLIFFDDPKLDKEFLEDFWTDILSYIVDKKVLPKDIKRLYEMSLNHVKAVGLQLPDMKTYNKEIKNLFFDAPGKIDGLTPSKFRPVLYKSSTLNEIRDLGTKYEVDVPRRLKKSELANIIIQELKDRNKYSESTENQVRSMNVLMMQRFAIDNDIKASTELKKEEIIEYILANAKETKESYFIPASLDVYEKEVHEVVAADKSPKQTKKEPEPAKVTVTTIEEPVPVPAEIEVEKVEEVKEQAIIEEPIKEVLAHVEVDKPIQYVQQTIDISELVSEIKKLREVIELAILPKEQPLNQTYEEKQPDGMDSIPFNSSSNQNAVILNSAEFYGDPKALKKIVKNDEVEKREKLVEARKLAAATKANGKKSQKNSENSIPSDGFFSRLFKSIGKFLKKVLKYLLLVLAAIAVLLIIYTVASYYLTSVSFFTDITNFLDGIFGLNIITRLHGFMGSIGL